jgi:autotransporter-associated beta strand protein
MVLTGTSTYTGSTTISAGVLQLGNGGTTGALSTSSAITDNGTFTINRSNAVAQGTDFSGSAIAGSGGFTQAGSGVTTLSAANSYSGPTNVNAGTLTVNGAHSGSGSVTVASGATLNGTGSLAGNVVVNGTLSGGLTLNGDATINMGAAAAATFNGSIANFGSISSAVTVASGKALTGSGSFGSDLTVNGSMTPGASGIGSDTITGNLGFGTSAQLSIVLGRTTAGAQPVGGTDYGQVTVGGNVSLDGTLALTIGTGIQEGDVFYLIVNNGINSLATAFSGITVNGSLISGNEFTYNGQSYAVSYTADASAGAAGFSSTTGNDLAVAAVPEPGTWAMIVGGLGMLVSFQRRKRSSH